MKSLGNIKQNTIDDLFLSSPGEDLVPKLMLQLSRVKGFTDLFGPYKINTAKEKSTDQQRWADYQRGDWSIRQLPAINVFESGAEQKTSDNAWLQGQLTIHVYWPPSFRRSDLARVPAAFKGVVENFFASKFTSDMLDELYYIERDCKVYGLNELGKELTWTTNVEGMVETDMVPVTMIDVRYRIDLRAWYRALEYMGRTQENPFEKTLENLTGLDGFDPNGILGVRPQDGEVEVRIEDSFDVQNP